MAMERKFVQDGLNGALMTEYFAHQLERAGYGGMNINRTPMGTQVTVFAEKPGMIIGKGGKTIRRLTHELESMFKADNPQIDVQEVKVPELNAQMMASRLANALERGWYFRKAGHNMLRRILDSGALGCEITISGKLTGPRARTEKFVEGYIKHAGKPAEEIVDDGFAVAVKKLGVIGCRVRITPPNVTMPGRFNVTGQPPVPAEKVAEKAEVKEKETIEKLVETSAEAAAAPPVAAPSVAAVTPQEETAAAEKPVTEEAGVKTEERTHDGQVEHKHEGFEYWHPASRVHKREGGRE